MAEPTDADVEQLAEHLFGVARSPWTWATRDDSVKVEWRKVAREAWRLGARLPTARTWWVPPMEDPHA